MVKFFLPDSLNTLVIIKIVVFRLNVKMLFPKFVKVFNKGTTKPAYQLMPPTAGSGEIFSFTLNLFFKR